jgi:hypothetical protein
LVVAAASCSGDWRSWLLLPFLAANCQRPEGRAEPEFQPQAEGEGAHAHCEPVLRIFCPVPCWCVRRLRKCCLCSFVFCVLWCVVCGVFCILQGQGQGAPKKKKKKATCLPIATYQFFFGVCLDISGLILENIPMLFWGSPCRETAKKSMGKDDRKKVFFLNFFGHMF